MALVFHSQGPEKSRERPLEDVFECVLPYLPPVDRAAVRSVCAQLRDLANGTCTRVSLTSPPVFHGLAASQLLKRFPRANVLNFLFSSQAEVKAATMFILTSQPDQGAQLARLKLSENRAAAQHLHQQQQQYGGYGQESQSRFQQYGYNSGARACPQTFDFTETLLASVCVWPAVKVVSVDKTVLLETEAAALARLPSLHELRLATNSSAQPLRRPLLQLMLSSLTGLRVLKLSYIRDTTADMALSLQRLTQLSKLTFQYAYWGESGAGERIMAALAKHQKQLAELYLYESNVNDDMLRLITGITSLRRLYIQDENAEEESCPTNKGLARITQLRRLEQLELFGEELQLDGQLLGLLCQLPCLRHLAMAGLDSLQPEDADCPAGAGAGFEELDEQVEELDLSSSMDGDEETEDSFSCVSLGGDEATSRPQPATATASTARAPMTTTTPLTGAAASSGSGRAGTSRPSHPPALPPPRQPLQQRSPPPPPPAPPQQQQGQLGGARAGLPAPLQVLKRLGTLRLYGPSSLAQSPPPLALLLPQPGLRHLKLSACASAANMRALGLQPGLHKLIVSHTSVPQLYPPPAQPAAAHHGSGGMFLPAGEAAAAQPPPLLLQPRGASILGYHSEVLAGGLASLRVLRIKDLPGLMDCHLADLAVVLARLGALRELKLRALGMLTDAGLATLVAVTQLRRLKLYALGDGVTEVGVAHLAACLPRLEELKVKDCHRVGPSLRCTVAAYRAASAPASSSGGGSAGGAAFGQHHHQYQQQQQQQQQQHGQGQGHQLVVRYGPAECDGGREPAH